MATNHPILPFDDISSVSSGFRRCVKCLETKPLTTFSPRYTKGGELTYRSKCRACQNKSNLERMSSSPAAKARHQAANMASYKKRRAFYAENPITNVGPEGKRCPRCETHKPPDEFYRNAAKSGLSSYCIVCTNAVNQASGRKRRQELKTENPKLRWALAVHGVRRQTAKEKGLPYKIDAQYLASIAPEVCPVLGIPLKYVRDGGRKASKPDSASVDRFQPHLGYVPGNVCVVSHKANTLKSDGNVAEIAKVLAWMLNDGATSDADRAEVTRIIGSEPITKVAA